MLGGWWLYLVFKLANKLSVLNHPSIEGNLIRMIQWEGLTFFIFLLVLTITFLYIYIQDYNKTKSLQAFFASLTHELKTPLASMKLQSQVITDLVDNLGEHDFKVKLQKYTKRLSDDSLRLEDQLDNHLQLSRLERNAPLNLREIQIGDFIKQEVKRYEDLVTIEIREENPDIKIKADDFALQTIFRNLIENSITHVKNSPVTIVCEIIQDDDFIKIEYSDNGAAFTGLTSKLGELFYKHNSPKGSGIGLYLMNTLTKKMHGQMKITSHPNLVFSFHFPMIEFKEKNA